MELQKVQETRQERTHADGSATKGTTCPHERPVAATKPSAGKVQEVKRPATVTTARTSEPVETNAVRERPLSSDGSDGKIPQTNYRNAEKIVPQGTHQNYTRDHRAEVQQTQAMKRSEVDIKKSRKTVLRKGRKRKRD